MKRAPTSPEFERFTSALRQIVSVPRSAISDHPTHKQERRKRLRAAKKGK